MTATRKNALVIASMIILAFATTYSIAEMEEEIRMLKTHLEQCQQRDPLAIDT